MFHTKQIKNGAPKCISSKYDNVTDALALPMIDTAIFDALPVEARAFLANIAEMGQKAIDLYHGENALKDKLWNRLISKELKKRLGFTKLKSHLECYDILITASNVDLGRHMDVSISTSTHHY